MRITFLYCFLIFMVKCQAQVGNLITIAHDTPALYVFGDSTVDCGSGSVQITAPYGIDAGSYPGRYSNGHTVADGLGLFLNLSMIFPYWVSEMDYFTEVVSGFGYASAPAGILPTTGSANNETLNMPKQIELFNRTVKGCLPRHLGSAEKTSEHLSNSVFAISIGGNDYLENYANGHIYNHTSEEYSRDEFSSLLISELQKYITDLYNLGARMIIVFEIGPIGCYPLIVERDKPEGLCANELNDMISLFNGKLYYKLVELSSALEGTNFFLAKTFRLIYEMVEHPYNYELADTKYPCCIVKENEVYCAPDQPPCKMRGQHLFWDKLHLTDKANRLIASKCLTDSSICLPITFQKLEGELVIVSRQPRNFGNVILCVCLLFIQSIVVTNFHYYPQ